MYAIANRRTTTRVVGLPMIWETPLRTGNLRDPNGPQVTFAFESFIDELAAAAKADPVQFRLDMLAASARKTACSGKPLHRRRARGRQGLWLGHAPVAEAARQRGATCFRVEASPTPTAATPSPPSSPRSKSIARPARVWVKRLVCAHDCGLVINPEGLRHTVECGMLHALSRALWEEVQFDTEKVTSVDWGSHPSLRHSDTPEAIDIVLVNGDPNPTS